jgi:hypothetical protein
MSALLAIGQIVSTADNVRVMPDPNTVLIGASVQLLRKVAEKCPTAQAECDQIAIWLDAIEKSQGLKNNVYRLPQDFSRFQNINDAVIEYLKGLPEKEATGAEVYEAMVAGNCPNSKLPDFPANFWRAVNTKNRVELEVERGESKNRDSWIIKLRPSRIPPKSTK